VVIPLFSRLALDFFTPEFRDQSQCSPCGICGRQSGTGENTSRVLPVSPASYDCSSTPYSHLSHKADAVDQGIQSQPTPYIYIYIYIYIYCDVYKWYTPLIRRVVVRMIGLTSSWVTHSHLITLTHSTRSFTHF
jgi:hypothetical protein